MASFQSHENFLNPHDCGFLKEKGAEWGKADLQKKGGFGVGSLGGPGNFSGEGQEECRGFLKGAPASLSRPPPTPASAACLTEASTPTPRPLPPRPASECLSWGVFLSKDFMSVGQA